MARKLKKFFEGYFPVLLGVIAVAFYYVIPFGQSICHGFGKLLESSITISSIAVGFLAAAKSILISLDDKLVVQNLKKVGHYERLISFFIKAIYACFFLTLFSSGLLLFEFKQLNWWKEVAIGTWLFMAILSAASCLRIINLFSKILRKSTSQ